VVTLRLDRIAQMSCNPAIGGVGKGHLVREVDALGGAMARVADATGIQFRRLNASRGAAVRSTRAQSDSERYRCAMTEVLEETPGVTLLEDEVVEITTQAGRVTGVKVAHSGSIAAGAVVVTTGTFLNGLCHVGEEQFAGGRVDDPPALRLSGALRGLGLELGRFKTGTTPRLAAESIRWHVLEPQRGDEPRPQFSFDEIGNDMEQVSCHITFTSEETHGAIRDGLHRSPLFQGVIQGTGPRYCPSIEDKVVRFADKPRHQVFLEPEGLDSEWVYPNGLSTSLPREIQDRFLRTIVGLEDVRVLQYGYAVEYDYALPTQLTPGLMTKAVPGLFLAGQINGTSGYEEAAAQGLMGGLNAVRYLAGDAPAVLGREQGYIGVLIDDLVTRGVDEPYRMFTSRAEHRLTLREGNAEERLWQQAHSWGLLSKERLAAIARRSSERELLRRALAEPVGPTVAGELGVSANETRATVLRRPEVAIEDLVEVLDRTAGAAVSEEIKYAGYIERERRQIERLRELERLRLPPELSATPGLSRELLEKLERVKPVTLGQASRIPGMTPAALALLRVFARRVSRET
jgi:tRNA uridine 5-carboxymethylaminomethyl modification enzyme